MSDKETIEGTAQSESWGMTGIGPRGWKLTRGDHKAFVDFDYRDRLTWVVLDGHVVTQHKRATLIAYLHQQPTAAEAQR